MNDDKATALRAATEAPLEDFTKGELVKMATQGWTGRVTESIIASISASFQTDQVIRSVRTQNETKRRFRICVEGFTIMRRDLGWAIPRILDELPIYLRCQLDGMDWNPDEDRQAWMSTDPTGGALDIDHEADDMAPGAEIVGGTEIGES